MDEVKKHLEMTSSLNTVNSEIFVRVLFSRSFVKIKPLWNGEITLPFTDVGKSCPCLELLMWKICLFTLFRKI